MLVIKFTGNSNKSAKYAKSSDFVRSFNRQALHAYKLELCHPRNKEYMYFCSDLPNDMRALIDEFEEITNYRNKNYLTTFINPSFNNIEAIYLSLQSVQVNDNT
ncbi:MAG: hypothetical protein ACR5K2_01185 [Wolbachia sp.]